MYLTFVVLTGKTVKKLKSFRLTSVEPFVASRITIGDADELGRRRQLSTIPSARSYAASPSTWTPCIPVLVFGSGKAYKRYHGRPGAQRVSVIDA